MLLRASRRQANHQFDPANTTKTTKIQQHEILPWMLSIRKVRFGIELERSP
jgi:hypothetical protein